MSALADRVHDRSVADDIDLAGRYRIEGVAHVSLSHDLRPRSEEHPGSAVEQLRELLAAESREAAELPELDQLLQRRLEVWHVHHVGEEMVERALVDLEHLRILDGTNRRRPWGTGDQPELPEGLASRERSDLALATPLALLLDHLQQTRADDVEGVRAISLAEHGLADRDRTQAYTAGQIVQRLDGDVLEHGDRVDQFGCLHAPFRLESELDPPPDRSDLSSRRIEKLDESSNERARDEGGEHDEKHARLQPARPQPAHEVAEHRLPVVVGGPKGEDREGDAEDAVRQEADVTLVESVSGHDLVDQIVAHERQRALTEVGDLDQVRQDVVAVQLEQRDQVHDHDEVVQDGELVHRFREDPARERPGDDRGEAREHELCKRPRE